MPDKTIERAKKDEREGKSASTQAGEFIREEIHHIREGKHGARSAKQAIAIGLSKARRAGVKLPVPEKGVSKRTAAQARRELKRAESGTKRKVSPARSRAAKEALEDEGDSAASKTALSRHATAAARKRTKSERSASARKAARTKGASGRSAAARKAARTRKAKAPAKKAS